ncbi:unnamed protein product [Rhodiola kirilowii]
MERNKKSTAFSSVSVWVRKQPKIVQASLAAFIVIGTLVGIHFVMDTDYFIVISEVMYTIALLVLVYKLTTHRNCSGLSLRTQEITAMFLVARLLCTFASDLDLDLHIVLDCVSLISTAWVIYMMRFKLQSTYIKELDNFPIYYLVVPCFVLALLVNPSFGSMSWLSKSISSFWAFGTYMESVSVLPQLRLIQNAKMVEPFTAHYVFALGVARLFGFAHWAYLAYATRGAKLTNSWGTLVFLGSMSLLAELVQTLILADFCYYYIKRLVLPLLSRGVLPMCFYASNVTALLDHNVYVYSVCSVSVARK